MPCTPFTPFSNDLHFLRHNYSPTNHNRRALLSFSMLLRRLCTSLSHSNFHPPLLYSKPPSRFPVFHPPPSNFPKLTHKSFSSSSTPFKMGDARRPATVPIPAPETADKLELYRALEASMGTPFSSTPPASPSPLIIVISGPSGVGKDCLIKRLREVRQSIHFVVTATTRSMRPGEVNGQDYFFMTKDEFLGMVSKNELLEYALVYGDYKGIPKQQIRDFMGKGYDIVLRVDIQGAATLRKILGNSAVFVFLVAESESELVKRLIDRKTETKETLLVRVATAKEEMRHVKYFDYVVVNAEGKLEDSVKLVESIIDAEKARVQQRQAVV